MKHRLLAIAMVAAMAVAFTAQASADGSYGDSQSQGYFSEHAVVSGTVTSASSTSFNADAYVVMPGDHGSSSTPTTTPVTITPGPSTKLIVDGKPVADLSSVQSGDTFYAVYEGVSATTDIATITGGTPEFVTAFMAPTPTFVVRGVITSAPTVANPDQFTATAAIVRPCGHGDHGFGRFRHRRDGVGYGYGCRIDGFWMGHQAGGKYGYRIRHRHDHAHVAGRQAHHRRHHRHHRHLRAHDLTAPTTGVVITVSATTNFDVNGNRNATASDLAVGQRFVAVFPGLPSAASLAALPPALSVYARTPEQRYGFIGTVVSTDTQATPNTITVNVTNSEPDGMFSGVTTFTVGADTRLFTTSGPSLGNVQAGDTVAGGVIAPPGETASQIEGTPLGFLVDRPFWFGDQLSRHVELRHLHLFLRRHHGHIRD